MPRILIAICLTLFAFARAAHAEDPAERAAKRHYERGQKLFGLQKFEDALEQFQKAFDAKPIPDFLFNIGQCQRNLGDYEAAIFSFKRYLKLDPETENREKVEGLIADLEEKQAAGTSARMGLGKKKREPDDGPTETSDGKPIYKRWWFWTSIAVVGAAGGVGIYVATRSGGPPNADYHFEFDK